MSIASEISRLQNAKTALKASINAKGGTIADETIDQYSAFVDALQLGGGSSSFELVTGVPTNVRIADNKLQWDAPDISAYSYFATTLKYYVKINTDDFFETTLNYYSLKGLTPGNIDIQIYAVLTVNKVDNSDTVITTIVYEYTGEYLPLDNLTNPKRFLAGASANGYAVFGGGSAGTPKYANVESYNANSGFSKSTLPSLAVAKESLGCAGANNCVVFAGGFGASMNGDVELFDMANGGSKTTLAALANAKQNIASVGAGNIVVFAGGFGVSSAKYADVENYDIPNGTKSALAALHAAKHLAGIAFANNNVVIGGGIADTNIIETYDLNNSGAKTQLPNLTIAGQKKATGVLNYAIFVSSSGSLSVDAYDMANGGVKSALADLTSGGSWDAIASAGNFAVVATGQLSTGASYYADIDTYNMALGGTKSSVTPLSIARSMLAGVGVNQYAVFAGGYSNVSPNYHANVESYNSNLF
jgi:hypothetical protein